MYGPQCSGPVTASCVVCCGVMWVLVVLASQEEIQWCAFMPGGGGAGGRRVVTLRPTAAAVQPTVQ